MNIESKATGDILEIIQKKVVALGSIQNFTGLITWDAIYDDNWKQGQMMDLHGTLNIKVVSNDYHMRFVTIIPPGKGFSPPHFHDYIETCTVIRGHLHDPMLDLTINEGEELTYDHLQPHEPLNQSKSDCVLLVDFINTNDKDVARDFLKTFNLFKS